MNERTLRPESVAAAAVVIGGLFVVAQPQHFVSIVRLVAVTIAAAAGLYALAVNVPEGSAAAWLRSPFNRKARSGREQDSSEEIARIRSKLSRRRQPIEGGPPLPPETLRLLQPLIRVALERQGLDPDDRVQMQAARGLLSPLTWAVWTSDPLSLPGWYRMRWPDERQVAEVVHGVLNDLGRIEADGGERSGTSTSATRGAT